MNLQQARGPIRQAFEATPRRVVELGNQSGERTPLVKKSGPSGGCCPWQNGLCRFLPIKGIELTNNAAGRALRPSMIQRKISHGVQSRQSAI